MFAWSSRKLHKCVGYVGVLSAITLFLSGMFMQVDVLTETVVTVKEKVGLVAPEWQSIQNLLLYRSNWVLLLDTSIHTLSVLQVSLVSFHLVATSIRAARRRDVTKHKTSMSQLHLLLADMYTPRIFAFFIRFALPSISTTAAFSLGCIIQWIRHARLIVAKAPDLLPANCLSCFLSLVIIAFVGCYEQRNALHPQLASACLMAMMGSFQTPSPRAEPNTSQPTTRAFEVKATTKTGHPPSTAPHIKTSKTVSIKLE